MSDTPHKFNWRTIGVIVGIIGMIVPWVWQAARYPDRAEFNEVKQEFRASEKEMSRELRDISTEQHVIKKDISYIKESQRRIEDSVNRVLEARHPRLMRGRTSR